MEWLQRINEAMQHIEAHLLENIDIRELARIACCSPFHFQRMFPYMADMPLSEYIRRRKMTRAALDLQMGDCKVIDIALKYGYDSPTAFNRAFQAIHGIAPSLAKQGAYTKAYPSIGFKLIIKGEAEMKVRIEKMAAFRTIGYAMDFSVDIEANFAQVPIFWQEVAARGVIPSLLQCMNEEPMGLLGISANKDETSFTYSIAVASHEKAQANMRAINIPAATWAVFECIGPIPQTL